jgi:dihydroorotase
LCDTIIHGRIITDTGPVESYVSIENGHITDLSRSNPGAKGAGVFYDFGNSLILPGAIDLHTHMRDPGLERKEDFRTGTISAAFGGVTAIVDMPNTIPPTKNKESFENKKTIASERSYIDYGLNLVLIEETIFDNIRGVFKDPAFAGFKIFMGKTTGSLVYGDLGALKKIREQLFNQGYSVSVHAEDGALFQRSNSNQSDILYSHQESRPPEAEVSAIREITGIMGEYSTFLHFLHISSSKGINIASKTPSTIEVTPHHLLLDIKNCKKLLDFESLAKVNPPIRTPSDRAALWDGVRKGEVDTIGSDHAPHDFSEKISEDPPSGIPGVETMIPLILKKVQDRMISIQRFIEIVSINPARRIGLQKRGDIREGFIADLMIIDMKSQKKISGEALHSKCGWTPYEGFYGIFPKRVFSRGEMIIEDEQISSKPGRGKPIREE